MNWLQQLSNWLASLKCWYTVQPWEQAIRVRCGKHVTRVASGLRVRIPFFDRVYVQNVRERVLNLPVQSVTTKAGECITLSGTVGWRLADVKIAYEQLHNPDDWILNTALAAIAETVYQSTGECSPESVGAEAMRRLQTKDFGRTRGIEIWNISITDLSKVRTYRLITGEGDIRWSPGRVGLLENPAAA